MGLIGNSNEEKIWNYLLNSGYSEYGVAGLMGNLYAESGLMPTNLQTVYEKRLGMTDSEYTAAVDNGDYSDFIHDCAGYGLAQWTFWTRKQNLLKYAKNSRKSIGDLEMQLAFLVNELNSFAGVLAVLKTAKSVKEASDKVLTGYECPADQSEAMKITRTGYGQRFYEKFAVKNRNDKEGSTVTESALRAKVVSTALKYLGYNEADGSHKKIIDGYNAQKPLPCGYKVKYTDEWCATFTSFVFVTLGLTTIAPPECGCERMINLYKAKGWWQEKDDYTPKPGDILMYDWQDSGVGDCTGWADHVGIIEKVLGNTIHIIEGNRSNQVKRCTLQINGKNIRGFCLPNYGSITTADVKEPEAASLSIEKDSSDHVEDKPQITLDVGDTVEFIGTVHYVSANAATGVPCKPGKATILGKYPSGKHPYQLKAVRGGGSTVYGWVDTADIAGSNNTGGTDYKTYKVVLGDTLWGIAVKTLGNGARYKEIMNLNGLSSTVLKVGQTLRIPNV